VSFVVLDTDVASRSLNHNLADPIAARLAGASIAIRFVTLGELTKWTLVRSWGPRRLAGLERFLSRVVVLPYSERVARRWASCRRTLSFVVDLDRRTTRGSRHAASCAIIRWRH